MSWFDRQVRQIKNSDQEDFENSIFRMASVVLGKHDAQIADDERMVTNRRLLDSLAEEPHSTRETAQSHRSHGAVGVRLDEVIRLGI